MADIKAPTVRMYIPKFDQVSDVNESDAQMLREQHNAIDEASYLAGASNAKSGAGNPFGKNSKKEAEAAAIAAAAEAKALADADAKAAADAAAKAK